MESGFRLVRCSAAVALAALGCHPRHPHRFEVGDCFCVGQLCGALPSDVVVIDGRYAKIRELRGFYYVYEEIDVDAQGAVRRTDTATFKDFENMIGADYDKEPDCAAYDAAARTAGPQ